MDRKMEPKTAIKSFRIPLTSLAELEAISQRTGQSRNRLVKLAIARLIDSEKQKPPETI